MVTWLLTLQQMFSFPVKWRNHLHMFIWKFKEGRIIPSLPNKDVNYSFTWYTRQKNIATLAIWNYYKLFTVQFKAHTGQLHVACISPELSRQTFWHRAGAGNSASPAATPRCPGKILPAEFDQRGPFLGRGEAWGRVDQGRGRVFQWLKPALWVVPRKRLGARVGLKVIRYILFLFPQSQSLMKHL